MGNDLAVQILLVLVLLQLKHFICDGPLQTAAMVRDKSHYGHLLGLTHSGIHGFATALVLAVAGLPIQTVLMLSVADFLLHYHIDFTKEKIVRWAGWNTSTPQFWWALSADQTFHQLTYVLMVWYVFIGV